MHFYNAFLELRNNKLRTFLSVLGISIGIFCIIAVLTMIDSFKKNIDNSLSGLGNDIIYINKFPWMPEPGEQDMPWWKYKMRPQAKYREMLELKAMTASIEYCSMLHTDNQTLTYQDKKTDARINAINYDFNHLQNFDLASGRYFTQGEMGGSSNSIILGATIYNELFGQGNAVGRIVKLYGRMFQVIGVLQPKGKDISGFNFENTALISYKSLAQFKNIEDDKAEFSDNTMMLRLKQGVNLEDATEEIKGNIRAQRRINPRDKNNFSINLLSTFQKNLDAIFITIDFAGFIIGFFSLLVGAFGIANIMFVTVKERTSQIGLKKALGAKPKLILTEFLLEAVLLSIIGGLIGIALVLIGAFFINLTGEFDVFFSRKNFILGISISAIVGILSGYIPAKRASQLNPIQAIRS